MMHDICINIIHSWRRYKLMYNRITYYMFQKIIHNINSPKKDQFTENTFGGFFRLKHFKLSHSVILTITDK